MTSSKAQAHNNDKTNSKQQLPTPTTDNLDNAEPQRTYPTAITQRVRVDPNSLTSRDVGQLQRTIGNQAVGRLLTQTGQQQPAQNPNLVRTKKPQRNPFPPIQTKLTIGQPNDHYEQEADRVATNVVQQINDAPSTQSKTAQRQEEPDEELQAKHDAATLQRAPLFPVLRREAMFAKEDLQAKSILQRQQEKSEEEISPELESSISSAKGGGRPLAAELQHSMGQAMGADFSKVRVHTNALSNQLNKSIQAKAFTTGQDVFFRQGAYEPESRGGQSLIAHELTHVVQQNGERVRRSPLKSTHEKDRQQPANIAESSVQSQLIQATFQSKNLTTLITNAILRGKLIGELGSDLESFVNTCGEAQFKELVEVKRIPPKTLKKYGANMLKSFVGAGPNTIKHVAKFDKIADGQIKGTHDEDIFRSKISETDTYSTIQYDSPGVAKMTPPNSKEQAKYQSALKKYTGMKKHYDKEVLAGRIPNFAEPQQPVPPQATIAREDKDLAIGHILSETPLTMPEVKNLEYQLRKQDDGTFRGSNNMKTTIKGLNSDSQKWQDFANEAIWQGIRAGTFGRNFIGLANNGVKVEGYYNGGDEVDTFFITS